MVSLEDLEKGKESICVVGLGYVGLPLAVALSKHFRVFGYDKNTKRVEELKVGIDSTGEVEAEKLIGTNVQFSSDPSVISQSRFIIVAVPTPVDKLKNPDLSFIRSASALVGRYMRRGSVVVYESTVYPGATEEVCVPILERESGLVWKRDFFVGYSPERINPGDPHHSLEKVVKVVSADTPQTLQVVKGVYEKVVKAGVYVAPDIKTAEAAKVIENIQRDINIALINELAIIFHRLGLDTREVLKAASTKWNFLKFEPGLVGGHCIPVDPYYLAHKSKEVGYIPELILAGRRVNEHIPVFVAHQVVKTLVRSGKKIKGARVLVLGVSFKENVPDVRNSKVYDLVKELADFEMETYIFDPIADREGLKEEYGLELVEDYTVGAPYHAVIFAVRHNIFKEIFSLELLKTLCDKPPILVDIKGMWDKEEAQKLGFVYWRL
ncbi:nucleotide sugar dehydrogenase [Thermocrinis albus DSM 14484]|uniref:Nucleotide sugar dehydrogenase n=1 Tax=Thermocrinis albus (strain DSM 14484 / JCM 11386 / HI 11/12) TaxID=638303 RepID=D3SP47_THEAH|nr:nucleotide sugar dehydrogenase [Thermocrinis albus]ADC88934.1 nucleotide sugar dehydrogenase [Thermocrinis albus DSM 14484]